LTLQQTAQGLGLSLGSGDADVNVPGKQAITAREPVIGHMGRLVADDGQAAVFGGSTTGVHFISQAEQQLQILQMHKGAFPSCAYGLYLHNLWGSSLQSSQFSIVADVVQQLPPNTLEILSSTIDRWTPLYPIVHKPSTIESAARLFESHAPKEPDVFMLYQLLGLLALGTIGDKGECIRKHRHFLCSSERYYSIAATLLDRIINQPSLQSLQGLVVIQVYLQLSNRYSIASHIGGVATRVAQTLGLHRHSQRFKFDPLETEMRRRAWWCQYSLDV
jgi:hypothetical protein